ncbi:MAG: M24 family metallopeptidase [Nitrospiraceae bacterium]|nr:M24 family metallopeptidase [Nitrospiraceae bacterium]
MARHTADRLAALRAKLLEAECDAFVGLAPPDNQYLTGFTGTTSAVLVTQDTAEFLCDSRYTEQAESQVSGYDVQEVSGSVPVRLGERLDALGVGKPSFDPAYLSVAQLEAIQETTKASLTPVPGVVSLLRAVKSPDEIARIREASRLAEGVLADLLGTLTAGLTERELAASFEYEFKRRGARGASFDTIALFGARSSLPHGEPDGTPLSSGDAVLLDFGCRLDGYCSDLTRTYAYDTIPGAWFETIYEVVLEAQRAALKAVRPGIECRKLDAVARDVIAEAGYGERFGHGLGHGVGIEVHEGPRLGKESETVLEEGMVVTIEPGIYVPGQGGVRIEDLVAVTSDGCEPLCGAPKTLKVL